MKIFDCIQYLAEITTSECIQLYILNKTIYSCNLARNPNLSEDIQSILIKDDDYYVRRNLAENINISEDIQLILFDGLGSIYNSFLIKEYLSKNTRICKEVQLKLCMDSDNIVRGYLAGNLGVCKEVQILLARESSRHIKSTLSKNKNLSQEANLILSKDKPI